MAADPDSLRGFVREAVEPGSTVRTDGWQGCAGLSDHRHVRDVQRWPPGGEHVLPRVSLATSLLNRWLLGTHQGAVGHEHLDDSLDGFAFRFNRRSSKSRGKRLHRLAEQAVHVGPAPFQTLLERPPLGGESRKHLGPASSAADPVGRVEAELPFELLRPGGVAGRTVLDEDGPDAGLEEFDPGGRGFPGFRRLRGAHAARERQQPREKETDRNASHVVD